MLSKVRNGFLRTTFCALILQLVAAIMLFKGDQWPTFDIKQAQVEVEKNLNLINGVTAECNADLRIQLWKTQAELEDADQPWYELEELIDARRVWIIVLSCLSFFIFFVYFCTLGPVVFGLMMKPLILTMQTVRVLRDIQE